MADGATRHMRTHVRPVELPLRDDPGGLEHVSAGAEGDALARLAVVQKNKLERAHFK